jgi:hypothetical protein
MSLSVTLFHFESDDIKIDIEARFEGEALYIDGYDIGKHVKEYWGDSDYEYILTIPPASVDMIYQLMNITSRNKESLLKELALRFNTNTCYSDIRKFLDENQIPCSGFTWT